MPFKRAAYAFTIVLSIAVSSLASNDSDCRPAHDTSQVGILMSQLRDAGWYEDGGPKNLTGPALYPPDMVAAGSMACAYVPGSRPTDDSEHQDTCKKQGGYQSVHLYVSIAHDISDQMAADASVEDPWWHDQKTKGRVFLVRTEDRDELQSMLARLQLSCRIVSYLYVSSHGSSAGVTVGKKGPKQETVSIGSFMKDSLSPCLFAPGAHIQFDGCSIACGRGLEASRRALSHVFDGHNYTGYTANSRLNDPFEGLQVYLNTDEGWNFTPPLFARLFGIKAQSYSVNGVGAILTREKWGFTANIADGKAPACHGKHSGALDDKSFEDISSGY